MPAFVTHELFGTQVFSQLDEEIQEMLEMNPAPYFWGLQGPDLLFFRDAFFGRSVLLVDFRCHIVNKTYFFPW